MNDAQEVELRVFALMVHAWADHLPDKDECSGCRS